MSQQSIRRFRFVAAAWWPIIVLATLACGCRVPTTVTAPQQPAQGPGGSDYVHGKVTTTRVGEGSEEYWLLQPDDPQPAEAPVVVFLHGWGATNPQAYGAWLQHIVRRGHIVVYPRYQTDLLSDVDGMPGNALRAVQAAWEGLNRDGPVRPARDRMAWVGHSLGGLLAANLAASHPETELPAPAVIMLVQPGGLNRLELAPLDTLPLDTMALIVLGDADPLVSRSDVTPFVDAFEHLPSSSFELVTIHSDDHAAQQLAADHFSPLSFDPSFPPVAVDEDGDGDVLSVMADEDGDEGVLSVVVPAGSYPAGRQMGRVFRSPPDALDYYGYWKLLDGLLDSAFRNRNREFALGGTQQQRHMGRHSDGVPVTPLTVEPIR